MAMSEYDIERKNLASYKWLELQFIALCPWDEFSALQMAEFMEEYAALCVKEATECKTN